MKVAPPTTAPEEMANLLGSDRAGAVSAPDRPTSPVGDRSASNGSERVAGSSERVDGSAEQNPRRYPTPRPEDGPDDGPSLPGERSVVALPEVAQRQAGARIRVDRALAALVGLIAGVMYWPSAFGVWRNYDDEGAMLVLYRSFAENGGLYRTTYSNYGPFPFALWWVVLRPFGFRYDNLFVGRALALVLLALSAVLATRIAARFAGRFTSVVIGLVVADLLRVNFNEPLHPGAVIGLLLLLAVWAQVSLRDARKQQLIIGVVCAALLFSKINLGFFALLAWGGTFVFERFDASRKAVRIGRLAVASLMTILPLALVASGSTQWRTVFMATSIASALALTSYSWFGHRPTTSLTLRQTFANTGWFIGGGLAVITFSVAVVLLRGSGVTDMASGMVGRAVRQRGVFALYVFADPLRLGLLGLSTTITLLCLVRLRRAARQGIDLKNWELGLLVFVELFAGGELLLVPSYGLSLLPAVALLVSPRTNTSQDRDRAAKLLFPVLLGVIQVLHAYPVAGSQMGWAMLVATLLGGLLAAQGAKDAVRFARAMPISTQMLRVVSVGVAGIAAVTVLGFRSSSRDQWAQYRSNMALDEKHARFVRLPAETVTQLTAVANAVESQCSGYYSLPGMGTFSVLTSLPLTSGFNATIWPLLFDVTDQRQIIGDLQKVDRLCVIRNEKLMKGWLQGRALPPGPLLNYLADFDRQVLQTGDYTVSVAR